MTRIVPFPITPATRPDSLIALQEATIKTRNVLHGDKYGKYWHSTIFNETSGRDWHSFQQNAAELLTDALAKSELEAFVQPRIDGQFYRVNAHYWFGNLGNTAAANQGRLIFPYHSVLDELSAEPPLPEGVNNTPIYLDGAAFDGWLSKQEGSPSRPSADKLPAVLPGSGRKARKRAADEEAMVKNKINTVLARAKKRFPPEKNCPSINGMAKDLCERRDGESALGYGDVTIRKILQGTYEPMKRFAIVSPYSGG